LQIYASSIYVQGYLYAGITPLQTKWKNPDCPLKRGSFNFEGDTCHNRRDKERTVLVQVTCFGAKNGDYSCQSELKTHHPEPRLSGLDPDDGERIPG
jgi:hypothetical protein